MSTRQDKIAEAVLQDANWVSTHGCDQCPIGQYCLPLDLAPAQAAALNKIRYLSRALEAGQSLVHSGDRLQAIYAVRAGCLKSVRVDEEGNEQIIDFHLPSELIGLDAIYSGIHTADVVTVTMAKVCIFPYQALLSLASRHPDLMQGWLRLFSKNLLGQYAHGVDNTADQRLAGFLLRIALRLPQRGELNERFLLPMSRIEIARHLRVANGTLSRMIARLQAQGMVRVDDRMVEILDFDKLKRAAGALASVTL